MPVRIDEYGILVTSTTVPLPFLRWDGVMELAGVTIPSIQTGTKNLGGSAKCSARVGLRAGISYKLAATLRCKSRFVHADLHNGKSEIAGIARCKADIFRAALVTPGGAFLSPPTIGTVGVLTASNSTYMAGDKAGVFSNGYAVVHGDSAYISSSFRATSVSFSGSSSALTSVSATGETVGGQTVDSGGTLGTDVGPNDLHYMTYVVNSKLFFYKTPYPAGGTTAAYVATTGQLPVTGFPARVYTNDNTTIHILYNTSFAASGKTYTGPAVVTSTDGGTSWGTPVRLIKNTWADGSGTSLYTMSTLYQVFSGDFTKFYLTCRRSGTSAGWIMVWIDLSAGTSSTSPITVALGSGTVGKRPWYVPAYQTSPSTTLVFMEATQFSPKYLKVDATTAAWQTPTVAVGAESSTGGFSANSQAYLQFGTGAQTHDMTYYNDSPNLMVKWRPHTAALYNTDGRTTLTLTTEMAYGSGISAAGDRYKKGRHVVVVGNRVLHIDWLSPDYQNVHVAAVLVTKQTATCNLSATSSGVSVGGTLAASTTATLDILKAAVVTVSGAMTGVVSASMAVHVPSTASVGGAASARTTVTLDIRAAAPAYLQGALTASVAAALALRAGKILVDGATLARTQISCALDVIHWVHLQAALEARAYSTSSLRTTVRAGGQISANTTASINLAAIRTIAGLAHAKASARCELGLLIDLSGAASCVCSVGCRLAVHAPVEASTLCVTTDAPPIVVYSTEEYTWTTTE